MAPGIFFVWSRADPDSNVQNDGDVTQNEVTQSDVKQNNVAEDDEDAETFSDIITALPGVSRAVRLLATEEQTMQEPHNHDVPFLTMYELPDIGYAQEAEFKEVEGKILPRETDGFKPGVYEEVWRTEGDGCENFYPNIGELVGICTIESPPPENEEEYWVFHHEEFVGAIRDGSDLLRSRVLKLVNEEKSGERTFPASPYLYLFEWDTDEMPWMPFVEAAQKEDWAKHYDSGIQFEVVFYNPTRLCEEPEAEIADAEGEEEKEVVEEGKVEVEDERVEAQDGKAEVQDDKVVEAHGEKVEVQDEKAEVNAEKAELEAGKESVGAGEGEVEAGKGGIEDEKKEVKTEKQEVAVRQEEVEVPIRSK